MEKVSGTLSISVFVDCPHCGRVIDLMDSDDTDGTNHNEECHVLKQAVPDGVWVDAHKSFSVDNVTCSSCKSSFHVDGLEW